MTFDFGCAADLYEAREHPRLLAGQADIERMRKLARSGQGKAMLEALKRHFAPLVQDVGGSDEVAASLKEGKPPELLNLLPEAALVGIVADEGETLGAVRRLLVALASQDKLTGPPMAAVAYDIACPLMTKSERRAFARWAAEKWVREHFAAVESSFLKHAGGNWPLCVHVLLALAGALALMGEPGAGSLKKELDALITMFDAAMHVTLGADGYPAEDLGYGTNVEAEMHLPLEALRRAGLYDAYTAAPRLKRYGRAVLHFIQPWGGDLVQTGDHPPDNRWELFPLARLAAETDDPALLWLIEAVHFRAYGPPVKTPRYLEHFPVSARRSVPLDAYGLLVLDELKPASAHPRRARIETQFVDRTRGIVTFRSGWGEDDSLVVFDASRNSPSAQGHFHYSGGHFTLSSLGEYFAISPGRYGMEQDQHNLVLVDGKSAYSTHGDWEYAKRHGVLLDYRPGDFVDFAASDSSHQYDCRWARRYIGLVKGAGAPAYLWTVDDVNKNDTPREFWWTLNTCPGNAIRTFRDHAVIRGFRCGNLLDVHFVLLPPGLWDVPHKLNMRQDVSRTSSYKYLGSAAKMKKMMRDWAHAPAEGIITSRPRLIAEVSGQNGRFMSLMIPRRKGDPPATVTRLESVPYSLAVRLAFPEVEDTIIWAYQHNLLEAEDIVGRGEWCLVRRTRGTGKVLKYVLGNGMRLSAAGRALPVTPTA